MRLVGLTRQGLQLTAGQIIMRSKNKSCSGHESCSMVQECVYTVIIIIVIESCDVGNFCPVKANEGFEVGAPDPFSPLVVVWGPSIIYYYLLFCGNYAKFLRLGAQ